VRLGFFICTMPPSNSPCMEEGESVHERRTALACQDHQGGEGDVVMIGEGDDQGLGMGVVVDSIEPPET
jgi:hypothetical protein